MATCTATVSSFSRVSDNTLDVGDKYKELMLATLSEDSLYIRAKDTFKVIFDDLELTSKEKATLVSEHVASMTTNMSATAMQTALAWSKEERDGAYTLAKLKADTEVALAQSVKTKEEICLIQKQTALQCANITATISSSIRENGTVATTAADGCTPTELSNNGLKYEQTKQVEAATYQIHADAFRKSGKVTIGADDDKVTKGLSGDDDGYTNQQTKNAERQRIAYEDSKINHAANSSASMIGQMLSAEISPNDADITRWRTALDRLLAKHSSTNTK